MTEKGIVFFPDPYLEATPADFGLEGCEDVFFHTDDGVRLHGWFVPGPMDRAVLLWFHGNAGNISHRLHNLKLLHDAIQTPIFIFDYREYGLSSGEITKEGTFLDAEAAFSYLGTQKGFEGSSILLFGRSLGTALAIHIASRKECLGMVLEAAFTSTEEMMALYFPLMASLPESKIKYDSLSLIDRVSCPILFFHGQEDFTIPISMSRRLYDKATSRKFFYEIRGAGHNDTYVAGGSSYFRQWQDFLRKCLQK